jgi:hypothetical protein
MHEGIQEYWTLLDTHFNIEGLHRFSADVTERMPELTHLRLGPIFRVS